MFVKLLREGHAENTHGKSKHNKGIQLESTDYKQIIKLKYIFEYCLEIGGSKYH